MSRTMSLEISDELYRALNDVAARQNRSAEEVGAQWFESTIERLATDPLMKLIGSIRSESDVSDWGDRHDYYIGEHLAAELRDAEE
jgi:hypothetical protein